MREQLKQLMPSVVLDSYRKVRDAVRYRYWSTLSPTKYPEALVRRYKNRTGHILNLDNPQTFDEKLHWIKLYDPTREKGRLSDKYLVRSWVAERVGEKYLVPLLGVWDDPDQIDFDALPDQFVLKATHGSEWNIIVRDKRHLDIKATRAQLRQWLALDYAFVKGLELQYRFCEPRVIAEQYLENIEGDLFDYKFFCFQGNVHCVALVRGRAGITEEACFDADWNRLPCIYYGHARIEGDVPRPAAFDEALDVATKLAQGFEHVRVDLYLPDDGSVRFGEMTFTTASGNCHWDPPEYNDYFGSLITMDAFPQWRRMHST